MLEALKHLWHGDSDDRRLTGLQMDPAVAVCALLLEASEVDQQAPPEEQAVVRRLLAKRFDLDAGPLDRLIADTRTLRGKAGDLWPFTHHLRTSYSPEQKQELLTMVWQVIFADHQLDPYEEQFARRLPEMLAVNQSVMIEAKRRARELGAGDLPGTGV